MILAQTQPDPTNAVGAVLFYLFALMAGGSALSVVLSRNIVRMAVSLLFTLTGVAGLYFLLNAEFLAAVQLVVYAGGTLILIVFGVMLTSKSPFSRFEPKAGEVIVAVTIAVVLLTVLILAMPAGEVRQHLEAAPAVLTDGSGESLPESLKSDLRYDADSQTLAARGPVSAEDARAIVQLADADKNFNGTDPAGHAKAVAELAAVVGRLSADSQKLFASHPMNSAGGYPMATLGQELLGEYLVPFEAVSVLLLVVMIGAAYLAKGRRRAEDGQADQAGGAARAFAAANSRRAREMS